MSRLYENTLVAVPTTLIRSAVVVGQFSAVESALDVVATELDASLRAPDGEVVGRLPALVSRQEVGGVRKALVWDTSGNPQAQVIATEAQITAGVAAADASAASAAAAAVSAASLATAVSAVAATLVVVTGTSHAAVTGEHAVLTNVALTTVTLPASPTAGDTVWVTPGNGLGTNVIARNGQPIMGLAEDMTLDNTNATACLRYINGTLGWRLV